MNIGSKTKIIATLGPATNDKEVLKQMIKSGLDVFRLNFSHGAHEEKAGIIRTIRELESELKVNVAILIDLQGPKLRIGVVEDEPKLLKEGDIISFCTDKNLANKDTFYMTYTEFAKDVKSGDIVLIDDGKIKLEVLKSDNKSVVSARVIYGGPLYSKKGVNLPDTKTSLPCLTEKDKEDLLFALNNDVDWIALSFVRNPSDIEDLREYISTFRKKINIIAKIEKPEAINNIDEIIELADGIMVARGDLGVEVNFDRVPVIQKMIVEKCILASKPVIIATQMMESMISNFRPTRAEATDVANAVLDGADALMLSGETSVGQFPVETIKAMQSIIDYTENSRDIYYKNHQPDTESVSYLPDSICYTACLMAQQTNAKAIIPFTFSGNTAIRLSSHRPKAEIYTFTANKHLLRRLPLLWGVSTFYFPIFDSIDKAIEYSVNYLLEKGLVQKGDLVIHIASTPIAAKDRTNMIKLSRV
ncbi:MAG TPA: pyruvate kinase [Bacteroidales bacterium]|nr:pyruvate kinase [Bacteroidales bacterium]